MKKVNYISVVLFLVISSCSLLSSNSSSILIDASYSRSLSSEDIETIELEVSGPGMRDILKETSRTFIQVSVEHGVDRVFKLTVTFKDGTVLSGETITDIDSSTGSITINLVQDDDEPGEEPVIEVDVDLSVGFSIVDSITLSSSPLSIALGESVTLDTGDLSGYTYEWFLDEESLSETGSTLEIGSQLTVGSYIIKCKASKDLIVLDDTIEINVYDSVAPTSSNTIYIEDIDSQKANGSIKVLWLKASDNYSQEESLEYLVDYSINYSDLLSYSDVVNTMVDSALWTTSTEKVITNLSPNTGYFIRLFVKDENNNITLYGDVEYTTFDSSGVFVKTSYLSTTDGSRENPYKFLTDAFSALSSGGTIYLGRGNYGYLGTVPDNITIKGGYSSDFSRRKYQSENDRKLDPYKTIFIADAPGAVSDAALDRNSGSGVYLKPTVYLNGINVTLEGVTITGPTTNSQSAALLINGIANINYTTIEARSIPAASFNEPLFIFGSTSSVTVTNSVLFNDPTSRSVVWIEGVDSGSVLLENNNIEIKSSAGTYGINYGNQSIVNIYNNVIRTITPSSCIKIEVNTANSEIVNNVFIMLDSSAIGVEEKDPGSKPTIFQGNDYSLVTSPFIYYLSKFNNMVNVIDVAIDSSNFSTQEIDLAGGDTGTLAYWGNIK